MDEYDELRHKDPEHARTVWVNWALGNGEPDRVDLPVDSLLSFGRSLVEHYQHTMGKSLFVELNGSDMIRVPGFSQLLEQLNDDGARTGIYAISMYDMEFWDGVKRGLNQLCMVVDFHDDQEVAAAAINLLGADVDVHVNYMADPENLMASFRAAKKFAKSVTEITINVVMPRGIELDEDDTRRLTGVTNQVRKIAADNRTRNRGKGHRGSMLMVDGEKETEITPRELLIHGKNSWTGWTCMAGVEQIVIDPKGVVRRGWCAQGGIIGDVREGIMQSFPATPIQCQAEFCVSPVDIACSKSWF